MSLREDFKDVGYEMARMVKEEVEKIEKKTILEIYYLAENIENQIQNDLLQLEIDSIQRKQFELNKMESERISKLNQTIAEKKTKYTKEFVEILKKKIRERIQTCEDSYIQFLTNKIQSFLPLINQKVLIQFNEEDMELIQNHNLLDKLGEKKKFFELSDEPLDSCVGFRIISTNSDYEIDLTFDAITEKYKQDLKMRFMKIFPVFEVNVPNAMEIDRKKHGGAKRYEV